jgi:ribonuclease P protein component
MVPQRARLPREAFSVAGYRRIASPFFSLKFKKNMADSNRIAVIIGKSVDKRATRRNFLERRVKAGLLELPNFHNDLIITVFPKANTLTAANFRSEIKNLLKKLPS